MTASVIRMGRYGHLSVRALGLGQDESWLAPNAQLHHGHRERLVRWLSCSRMIETSPPRPLHMATAERAPGQAVTEPVAALLQAGLPGSLLEAGAEGPRRASPRAK